MSSKFVGGLAVLGTIFSLALPVQAGVRLVVNSGKHPDCSGALHTFEVFCGEGKEPAVVIGHKEAALNDLTNCKAAHPGSPEKCVPVVVDVENVCQGAAPQSSPTMSVPLQPIIGTTPVATPTPQ